ncbi:hypothetical protein LX32DRAFT_639347 [Colletotrichum zoysiae]|uniref:Uncharacterized protein n=1 Tax=Colletotrichum zoysiae TaxID=1216348 RepID=A0AAD9HJJ1_9PEZI|nr:hypothetical protein LX32DRAFT_639347 [Colletotrichum zoysiae]
MANASQNRRSQPPPSVPSQMSPPMYTGETQDEWSPASREAAAAGGGYSRRRTERHARRQSSSAGARAPGSSDPQLNGDAPEITLTSPRVSSMQQQQQQQQDQLQVPNPGGDEIGRIQSPSISKSVLEPLQRKMLEYHNLMVDAEGQMAQLDEELRALQDRRLAAERRFVDAKAKHDEYERQHLDVERALRGDFSAPPPPPPPQQQQQPHPRQSQQHMYNGNSPPRTAPRPASSIMSYDERPMSGHSSVPRKGKLRFSLFGR